MGFTREQPVALSPVDALLNRFSVWLERERHLAPLSVTTYVSCARPLLERLAVADRSSWSGWIREL